jgi:hypothetical protein
MNVGVFAIAVSDEHGLVLLQPQPVQQSVRHELHASPIHRIREIERK